MNPANTLAARERNVPSVNDPTYDTFRTGMTFKEMAGIMAEECRLQYASTGQYIPVRRRGVLRRLRAHKEGLYAQVVLNLEAT